MQQIKITFHEDQGEFLENYETLGFKDKSALVREAVERLRKSIEEQELEKSAKLYAELYEEDSEIIELAEDSIKVWSETTQ